MRIMIVVNEFPPQKVAGTAVATRELAGELQRRGHAVHVVVTTRHPKQGGEPDMQGLSVSWMPDRPFRGIGVIWRLWHLWRIARGWQPDILQGQAISCGLLAALVGKGLGVPSLAYAQGQDVYQASRLQRVTEVRWACRLSTSVAAVSSHLAAELAAVGAGKAVRVIPHGFRLVEAGHSRVELRRQWQVSDGQQAVLSAGRLERIKGHDVLLDAWPRVIAEVPQARLWLAGDGSRREALQAQAKVLGISGSVRFFGQQDAAGIAACMAAADLFVLPSRSEAFGITLLEAMAHALPVVATRVGGVPEVLPEHGDAALLEAGDAPGLASAIIDALRAGRYPSTDNRGWALRFEWGSHVLHFEDAYRALPVGVR